MNNYPNFNDKVALVTGASSGMGLATAQAFAEAGASVTLADVKEEAVRQAAEKLVNGGHRALAIPCDVSNDAQVEAMVEQTVAEFGRLDAAFNNAGVMAKMAPTADSTLEEFDRVTHVNLRGVWTCMKHELRQMERQGSGAIVNCSSIGGLRGDRGIPSYTASKHGVIGLTRAAALEYAAKGIRVNAACAESSSPSATIIPGSSGPSSKCCPKLTGSAAMCIFYATRSTICLERLPTTA
jgi:NAD(P)-dependent dehydrogenase (short-subunit alcohol dehydrogenase family)